MPGTLGKVRRVASNIKRRVARYAGPHASFPATSAPRLTPPGKTEDFTCNVCGQENRGVPTEKVENRETQTCGHCHSSLRMRSVMHTLSLELFGKALTLPQFPEDKRITGLGMSDWEGYADRLAAKLGYTNTFYHCEPRLDITDVPDHMASTQQFLISSDVFEHIPVFALDAAFRNCRKLLRDDGVFIFTVPFVKTGETREHFPRMHDFRIIETQGKRYLYNKTAEGQEEIFSDLCFHGGDGMTLEMRMFSEPDLYRRLREAGFSSVKTYAGHAREFGIIWPMDWAVPIAARA